jgi:hypothetical protein
MKCFNLKTYSNFLYFMNATGEETWVLQDGKHVFYIMDYHYISKIMLVYHERTNYIWIIYIYMFFVNFEEKYLSTKKIPPLLFRLVWFMVFNATLNNISVISWQSVLLVEKTQVPGENHRPVASHWQILSHNVVSGTPRHEQGWNSQL